MQALQVPGIDIDDYQSAIFSVGNNLLELMAQIPNRLSILVHDEIFGLCSTFSYDISQYIYGDIKKIFGDEHNVIGPGINTEFDRDRYNWILDPIDSAVNAVNRLPGYGANVGLYNPNGDIIMGLVVSPWSQNYWAAMKYVTIYQNNHAGFEKRYQKSNAKRALYISKGEFNTEVPQMENLGGSSIADAISCSPSVAFSSMLLGQNANLIGAYCRKYRCLPGLLILSELSYQSLGLDLKPVELKFDGLDTVIPFAVANINSEEIENRD